jgi:hypothetical protein
MIPGLFSGKKEHIEDPLLRKVGVMNGIIFALLLLGSGLIMSPKFTLGVGLGGIIILINYQVLYFVLIKALIPGRLSSPKVVILKYYLRLLGTGCILYILIAKRLVDPLGLIIGLSVVVINLTLLGFNEMRKILFKEAN